MKPPSEPKINKDDPDKYFIYWNHDVPTELWEIEKRKRKRIKVYDDINSYQGDKDQYAEERRLVWKYKLEVLKYDPFAEDLKRLKAIKSNEFNLTSEINKETEKNQKAKSLTAEQKRKQTPINTSLDLFLSSREDVTNNTASVAVYRTTVNWLKEYFISQNRQDCPIDSVTRIEITEGLKTYANKWNNTTYNNNMRIVTMIFKWLKLEQYISQNPIETGSLPKKKENKEKNKWYDKDLKNRVKTALIESNEFDVYRAMQFTYMILIRSGKELRKLKVADIDRKLKRVRFSADLSKNNMEAYRDYPPEFDDVLDDIDFDNLPPDWYLFGRGGAPGPEKCGAAYLAERWRPVRDHLKLSDKYTIYGMKHTRIVHELFKGTDGYDISYMARHEEPKSTKQYTRDYDITLRNKYGPEDLKF